MRPHDVNAVVERDQPGEWMELAACRGMDPDIFHPSRGEHAEWDAARAICSTCPVRWRCLDLAVENRERHGMWGGMSARERGRVRATGLQRERIRSNAYLEARGLLCIPDPSGTITGNETGPGTACDGLPSPSPQPLSRRDHG